MTDERVKGKIVAQEEGRVRVLLPLKDDCSACGRCGLNAAGGKLEVWALGGEKARPGDEVEVLIPRRDRLEASLLLFGLPLVCLFAGAAVGTLVGASFGAGGETAGVPGAGVGLLAGFILVRRLEKRRKAGGRDGIRVATSPAGRKEKI